MSDKKQITLEDLEIDLETLQAYMDRERALIRKDSSQL